MYLFVYIALKKLQVALQNLQNVKHLEWLLQQS